MAFNFIANVLASYWLFFISERNSLNDSGNLAPTGTSSRFTCSNILYKSLTSLCSNSIHQQGLSKFLSGFTCSKTHHALFLWKNTKVGGYKLLETQKTHHWIISTPAQKPRSKSPSQTIWKKEYFAGQIWALRWQKNI